LFQAENKEKDIEDFMANIKNVGKLGGVVKKLRTNRNIAIVTEDVETQTTLNMVYFQRLEKKMPTFFKLEELTAKIPKQETNGQ
jgi:hypothetical protein